MQRTYEAFANQRDLSHVFCYSPKDGHVLHFARFPFSTERKPEWSFVDLTEHLGAPTVAASDKVVSVFGSQTVTTGHVLIYKGEDGFLHLLSLLGTTGQWEHKSLSQNPKVRPESSLGCISIGELVYVIYIAEDSGHILSIEFKLDSLNGEPVVVDCTEKSNSTIKAENMVAQVLSEKDIGIFFIGEDLRVHHIQYSADNNNWTFEQNIYNRPVARAKQSILAMCCFVTENKDGHVLFIGTDNHIHEVYRRKGKWIHKDITEDTSGTPEASRQHPITCVIHGTSTHIYFVSGEEEYFTLYSTYWTEENDDWKTTQLSDTCWQASNNEDEEDTTSFRTLGPITFRLNEEENEADRITIMGTFRPKQSFWAFVGEPSSASEGSYEMMELKEVNTKGEPVDRAPVVVVQHDEASAIAGIGKGKGRKSFVSEADVSTENLKSVKLKPMYYSKKKAAWVPLKKRDKAAGLEITALTLITFNVLFNKVLGDIRQPALLELVNRYRPDVIAFQEADLPFLKILLNTAWVREYYLSDTEGTTIRPYGCLLLSRIPWCHLHLHDLPSKLGRKVVIGEFHLSMEKGADVRKVLVATSHLESYPQDKPIRKLQLATVTNLLKEADDAIFMGDFNFADKTENTTIDAAYTDLWMALHPDEEGFTFNYRENELTKATRNYEICRYDRIYLRSAAWQPKSMDIIGKDPIELPQGCPPPTLQGIVVPRLWPSDHFGLHAVLQKKNT